MSDGDWRLGVGGMEGGLEVGGLEEGRSEDQDSNRIIFMRKC